MKAEERAATRYYRARRSISTAKPLEKTTPVEDYWRPRTRADCYDHSKVPRPCPYVGCVYNLYLDVNEKTGSLVLNHGPICPTNIGEKCSCALDVVEENNHHGLTLMEVGALMSLTRERIRQIEVGALTMLRQECEHLEEYDD